MPAEAARPSANSTSTPGLELELALLGGAEVGHLQPQRIGRLVRRLLLGLGLGARRLLVLQLDDGDRQLELAAAAPDGDGGAAADRAAADLARQVRTLLDVLAVEFQDDVADLDAALSPGRPARPWRPRRRARGPGPAIRRRRA